MSQTDLFPERDPIEVAFWTFHRRNPEVYRAFSSFALQGARACEARRRPPRVGSKAVWERMRWHLDVEVGDRSPESPWQLNNNFTALYSRLFMREHPEYSPVQASGDTPERPGLFETRERRKVT